MENNIARLDKVGLRHGTGREVLSDISLTLRQGGFHVLTGASGAGKTSLLQLLGLAHRPSRGVVRIFGADVFNLPRSLLPEYRRRIGMVFQDLRLIPHLSVFGNVALPLRLAGMPERNLARPVAGMLERTGLSACADSLPGELSMGERQLAAVARAAVGRPELLLADEPAGHVDADHASALLRLFEAMNRRGATVVIATHDMAFAGKMKDAAVLRLDRGRMADPVSDPRESPLRQPAA